MFGNGGKNSPWFPSRPNRVYSTQLTSACDGPRVKTTTENSSRESFLQSIRRSRMMSARGTCSSETRRFRWDFDRKTTSRIFSHCPTTCITSCRGTSRTRTSPCSYSNDGKYLMLHCRMITGKSAPAAYPSWIEAIVVVSFDVDEGQKVSMVVPGALPPAQEKGISMLAFPDSNSCSQNENIFKYLFKTQSNQYAFVCFKQKKDPSNPRGYAQKSFVVLTKLPFLQFYEQLVELIVFKLFPLEDEAVREALDNIYTQSTKWPDPQPLSHYVVPVLDYELTVEIPNYLYDFSSSSVVKVDNMTHNRNSKDVSMERIVTRQTLMQFGRFQQVKLTETFELSFGELWMVWESAMLNRPLLMISDNPYRASRAVLAAVSLMNPLEYGGEFHPYVTVYDSHLDRLQQAKQDVLIGATNPLFLKLFANKEVEILQMGKGKVPKRLKPLKQLFINNGAQSQQLVNESSLRKFFYRVNCGVISALQAYVQMQTNDLKFLNEKDFLRFVRKKWTEDSLLRVFDGQRLVTAFWQAFVQTRNFALLLRSRNIMREKT